MSVRKFFLLAGCLLLIFSLASCNTEQTDDDTGAETETAIVVNAALVEEGALSQMTVITGQLEAITTSNVAPSGSGGKVESVNVQIGSQVSKGQTLVTLEFPSKASLLAAISQAEQGVEQAKVALSVSQASINQAQQGAEQAKAGLSVSQATIKQAEQGVEQAKVGLASAKVDYDQAVSNYERGKELLAGEVISQGGPTGFEIAFEVPYQKAKVNYEQLAPANVASAEAAAAAARESYQVTLAAVSAAEASVASAKEAYQVALAAVNTAEAGVGTARENYNAQLNNTYINSPISGVVTAVNVKPGEIASAAAPTPVVTVVDLSRVQVKTNVTEGQINKISQGQQVPVLVKSASPDPFNGTITNIALAADTATKSYPIKVQIDNAQQLLKPGMFAEVQLEETRPQTLLVPSEAVTKKGSLDVVWVITEGRASSREVTLGSSDDQHTEIMTGLNLGEQIVTVGHNMLDEDTLVEIREQENQQ